MEVASEIIVRALPVHHGTKWNDAAAANAELGRIRLFVETEQRERGVRIGSGYPDDVTTLEFGVKAHAYNDSSGTHRGVARLDCFNGRISIGRIVYGVLQVFRYHHGLRFSHGRRTAVFATMSIRISY